MKHSSVRKIVYAMFFASGMSGLMYEVVWVRMLERLMGVTVYATSTVLAAFMAGLALGSFVLGRYIDRRDDELRVYAILELLIAGTALLVPVLLWIALPIYRTVYQATGGAGALTATVRAATCFLTILVPTTMMGGTLPILTSFLVKRESVFGKNFSLLYGLNTVGAVFGVLVSGFVTLGTVGELSTIFIGAAINVAVGITALVLYRRASAAPSEARPAPARSGSAEDVEISPYGTLARRFVLVAFALSGLTALAYEVIWMRQLVIFLRTSIYVFSGMLAVFLAGIGIGSLLMTRYVDRLKKPLLVFAGLELAVAFISIVNLYLFAPLDSNVARTVFGLSSAGLATIVIVFPLALMFGMITPVAGRSYVTRVSETGTSVGWFYGANTVGSIAGSLLAGYLLVPVFGSTAAVMTLAVINLVLAVALVLLEPARAPVWKLAYVPAIALVTFLSLGMRGKDPFLDAIESRIARRIGTTWIPGQLARLPESHEIFFHEEGLEGTVTAFAVNQFPQFWINGTGMTFLATETKLMAHLPTLFVDDPSEFLAVCFGMGTTIRSATRHAEIDHVTTVELVPEAFETFKFYHEDGEQILSSGRVTPIADDGRNFLLMSTRNFDIITVDPPPPIWSARTVNLYTQEFFELARARLNPGGVMMLWFPTGTKLEIQSILKTFLSIFPHTTVWSGPHSWGFYFIGTQEPVDLERVWERAERMFADPVIHADLTEWDDSMASVEQLKEILLWNEEQAHQIAREGVIVTDDRPFTEFPLWRYLAGDRAEWHPQWDLDIGGWKSRAVEEGRRPEPQGAYQFGRQTGR